MKSSASTARDESTTVRVVAAGFPGADPLAVRIGQATFALRRHEASMVLVQPEANA